MSREANAPHEWFREWSHVEWPADRSVSPQLGRDLLDCLVHEVVPLTLDAIGLSKMAEAFRRLGSIHDDDGIAAYEGLARAAAQEVSRLGRQHLFFYSLAVALREPPPARLNVAGAAWMAVARAVACGAPPDAVRNSIGRVVSRHLAGAQP